MESDQEGKNQGKSTKQRGIFRSTLSKLGRWYQSNQNENEFIDYVINIIEPKLKRVRGYKKRLKIPLQHCREHCQAMIFDIPGPIFLNRSGYNDNPIIRSVFAGPDLIEPLLERADTRSPKIPLSGTKRVALLTMTSKEKTIFGRKKQGDMVIGDAALRTINFTNHNMVGLAETLEDSRKALEKFSLDIIAEAAARELSEIRTNFVDLQQRRERLRAMKGMFGESQGLGSVFVPYDPAKHEKQKKLEQMLAETEDEIAAARQVSETPEDWLKIVEEFLNKPENILSMQLVSLRLDWRNVLTDDPDEKANTITFATFSLADEMQREGILVTYEKAPK